ncbi:hypothetical protein LSAT2_005346 [Lamellibrachia satsuma]|nr:hypothetical protein LSAT2_005346 [Lamellibrachia satsuma]
MSQPVLAPMVVTYSNKIFVFGGLDSQNIALCCTQVFDTTRGQWSILTDMPEGCNIGAAVTLNGFIYVVGGLNRTCLKYDPVTDCWTRLSQPRKAHCNAPAVVWHGCILVAGGGTTMAESSAIEQYNPLTDTWSDWKTTLSVKTFCHSMFCVDLFDRV